MVRPTYCSKCKKWNLFGDLDVSFFVKKQMKKEKTKESVDEIYAKKKYLDFFHRYLKENNFLEAGCCVSPNCVKCGTNLIVKANKKK
ncbi:MAG: hypothetical protein ABII22_06410 [Candidatus Micrarchaeota archaeon]